MAFIVGPWIPCLWEATLALAIFARGMERIVTQELLTNGDIRVEGRNMDGESKTSIIIATTTGMYQIPFAVHSQKSGSTIQQSLDCHRCLEYTAANLKQTTEKAYRLIPQIMQNHATKQSHRNFGVTVCCTLELRKSKTETRPNMASTSSIDQ